MKLHEQARSFRFPHAMQTNKQTNLHTYIHMYVYIHVHIYIYIHILEGTLQHVTTRDCSRELHELLSSA